MPHPDEPVDVSFSVSGSIEDRPARVIAVVVSDEDNEPSGILEKWSKTAWIYADADSVELLEPENGCSLD
jgi:hypothetical protein